MIYTIDEISRRIQPVASAYGLRAVYLFGSYARGEATENSDIDLLIDTSGTNLRSLFPCSRKAHLCSGDTHQITKSTDSNSFF